MNKIHLIGGQLLARGCLYLMLAVYGTTLARAERLRWTYLVAIDHPKTTRTHLLVQIGWEPGSYHTEVTLKLGCLIRVHGWLDLLKISTISYHIGERLNRSYTSHLAINNRHRYRLERASQVLFGTC